MSFKKIFIYLSCVIFLSSSSLVYSYDASPRCYRDLELNFFQAATVSQALSMHGVNQSIWTPIIQQLQGASQSVPSIIRAKAEKMRPNPFTPLFIPEVARELLLSTLLQLFADVLAPYQSFPDIRMNANDVQDMFDYILNQQRSKVDRCLGVPSKK